MAFKMRRAPLNTFGKVPTISRVVFMRLSVCKCVGGVNGLAVLPRLLLLMMMLLMMCFLSHKISLPPAAWPAICRAVDAVDQWRAFHLPAVHVCF